MYRTSTLLDIVNVQRAYADCYSDLHNKWHTGCHDGFMVSGIWPSESYMVLPGAGLQAGQQRHALKIQCFQALGRSDAIQTKIYIPTHRTLMEDIRCRLLVLPSGKVLIDQQGAHMKLYWRKGGAFCCCGKLVCIQSGEGFCWPARKGIECVA